jgi:hypothetical protein
VATLVCDFSIAWDCLGIRRGNKYVACLAIVELVMMWCFYLVGILLLIGPIHHIAGIAYSTIATDMFPEIYIRQI